MASSAKVNLKRALKERLELTHEAMLAVQLEGEPASRAVHRLRVASRRSKAALEVVEPLLDRATTRSAKRSLRNARRAAADTRACDVDLAAFAARFEATDSTAQRSLAAIAFALGRLTAERDAAGACLLASITDKSLHRVRTARKRCARALKRTPSSKRRDSQLLASAITDAADSAKRAARDVREAPTLDAVHGARIALKQLRYTLEFAGVACAQEAAVKPLVKHLAMLQDELGLINDAGDRAGRIGAWLQHSAHSIPHALIDPLRELQQQLREERDDALGEVLAAWPAIETGRIERALRDALAVAASVDTSQSMGNIAFQRPHDDAAKLASTSSPAVSFQLASPAGQASKEAS